MHLTAGTLLRDWTATGRLADSSAAASEWQLGIASLIEPQLLRHPESSEGLFVPALCPPTGNGIPRLPPWNYRGRCQPM